jgi:hypothetical protein
MSGAATLDPVVWARAYERVENRLLAYRVRNRFLLTQLTREILEQAAARREQEPDRAPEDLAAEEAERSLDAWIARLSTRDGDPPIRQVARGRAAIYLAGLPERWPASFLDHDPPPELVAELRSIFLEAGPNLEFTNMAPRPFDLGPVSEVAGGTWRTFAKWPILRTLTVWCLFALLLGTAFYLTRL